MMKSRLALIPSVGILAGIAASTRAESQAPPQATAPQAAVLGAPTAQDAAVKACNANLNPNAVVPSLGIYDQEDGRTGRTGTPLPGWGSIFGEGAGDN
jgi:hypothetical protein